MSNDCIKDKPKQKVICQVKLLFVLFYVVLTPCFLAQDSIPIAKDLTEEKELEFQQFFFKALSEKSIGNYQNAIQNLENCNQILGNDVAVFFEFSKNYLMLNQFMQAQEYIKRAIEQQPQNIWLLKHYVAVLDQQRNYPEAIKVQSSVVQLDKKEEEGLVELYLKNRDYQKAFALIDNIEKNRPLSSKLKYFKKYYKNRWVKPKKQEKANDLDDLKKRFADEKSFETLLAILKKSTLMTERLEYVDKGLQLFPAQSVLYLRKGEILFQKKQYKETISVLENGIDFVIEDEMLVSYYKLMMRSYEFLGDKTKVQQYKTKLNKLKK